MADDMGPIRSPQDLMQGHSPKSRRSVLIIADQLDHGFYRLLSIEAEEKEICTPANASHYVENCDPQLIVIDAGSDIEKGLALVRSIKEMHVSVPIVFIGDDEASDLAGKSLTAGARLFQKKPVNINELQGLILTLIRLKRLAREKRTPFPTNKHSSPGQSATHQAFTADKPLSVLRSISYISNNLASDITLEQLATEAHLSKYHFCRLFKKHFEMTPMEFISRLRMRKAKDLLLREDLNISMVAAEVGYNHDSTFIRHFKKITGLTPREYKKSLKKVLSQPQG